MGLVPVIRGGLLREALVVARLRGHGGLRVAELLRGVGGFRAVAAVGEAVALHFLVAQLADDGCGHRLGDDVELAVLEALVDDEAHERLPVHHQSLFGSLCREVGFRFSSQGGVVAEQAAVVVGVHQHGVERGRVLLAGADHLFAAHLLFGFFGNLNRGYGSIEHLVRRAFERILHFAFEPREDAHCRSLRCRVAAWRHGATKLDNQFDIVPHDHPDVGILMQSSLYCPTRSLRVVVGLRPLPARPRWQRALLATGGQTVWISLAAAPGGREASFPTGARPRPCA